jgi:hypothetical protein
MTKFKEQFFNLKQAYRRPFEMRDLLASVSIAVVICEIIYQYDYVPISENVDLNNLPEEELQILKESSATDKLIQGLHESIKKNNFERFQKRLFEAQRTPTITPECWKNIVMLYYQFKNENPNSKIDYAQVESIFLFTFLSANDYSSFESVLTGNLSFDLNFPHPEHGSVLHAACRAGISKSFAQKLLEVGADPNIARIVEGGNRISYTSLEVAAAAGRGDLIALYKVSKIPVKDSTWQCAEFRMQIPHLGKPSDVDYTDTYNLIKEECARISADKAATSTFPSTLVVIQTSKEKPDEDMLINTNKETKPYKKRSRS